jgi:hypothetical protein
MEIVASTWSEKKLVLLPQFFGQLPKGLASTLLTLKH